MRVVKQSMKTAARRSLGRTPKRPLQLSHVVAWRMATGVVRACPQTVYDILSTMPAPASTDLRQRLVDAYEAGEGSLRELAEEFRVHFNTAWNWVQRYRATGSVAPRPGTGGPKPKIDAAGQEILRAEVRAQPDATLVELAERYQARTGISVSDTTICDALKAMDLPRKKSRRMRANSTVPTSRSSGRASRSRKH